MSVPYPEAAPTPLDRTWLAADELGAWTSDARGKRRVIDGITAALGAGALVSAAFHPITAVLVPPILVGRYLAGSVVIARDAGRHFVGPATADLGALDALADGTIAHVRGRVRPLRLIEGLLAPRRGVCRRVDVRLRGYSVGWALWREIVHVAGCDFDLEDPSGARVRVQLGPSTLIWSPPGLGGMRPVPSTMIWKKILSLPMPRAVSKLTMIHEMRAGESMFAEGDEVEVVGSLSREADPEAGAIGRDTGWLRTLVSAARPLMIRAAMA